MYSSSDLQFASEMSRLFPETKHLEFDIPSSPISINNATTSSYSPLISNSLSSQSQSQESSPEIILGRRFNYTQFGASGLQEYEQQGVFMDGGTADKPEVTNEYARNACEDPDIGFEFQGKALENSKESYDTSRVLNTELSLDIQYTKFQMGLETPNIISNSQTGSGTPNRIFNSQMGSEMSNGIWNSETSNGIWNYQLDSETQNKIWNSQMGSEAPNKIWNSQMGSETPNKIWNSQMDSESPNKIWNSQMGSKTPNRFLNSQMGSKTPNRSWNSQMGLETINRFRNSQISSETPNRFQNSQIGFETPVRTLDTYMILESPKRTVETENIWETPKRFWNTENDLVTSRRYLDTEPRRLYQNMKMDSDIPITPIKRASDNPTTIFGMSRGTVEGTKSGTNVQRKLYREVNPIIDLPQRNPNARPVLKRTVSLCDNDDFVIWQPLDPMQTMRSSTPHQSYELFPNVENAYFHAKTPSPPTSMHRSQSQLSMDSRNSAQYLHASSLDQSLDQSSLLNYSFSPSTVFDRPPVHLNVIKPNYICTFCRKNGETPSVYTSHVVKMKDGKKTIVTCPILRSLVCTICHQSGDNAHTITYCPELRRRNNGQPLKSTTVYLKNTRVKSNGRKRY